MMGNYHVRFGGGLTEKCPNGQLAGSLPYDSFMTGIAMFLRAKMLGQEKRKLTEKKKDAEKAFNFTGFDDIDFKRCWSLTNLQLMWGSDNIAKGGKLSKPFQPALALAI